MDASHDAMISQFVERTGEDSSVAKGILIEHRWDMEAAVKTYTYMKRATLPHVGPQKNVENWVPNNTVHSHPPQKNLEVKGQVKQVNVAGGAPGGRRVVSTPMEHAQLTSSPSGSLTRKLKRGLSKTTDNIDLVNKARDLVLQDVIEDVEGTEYFVETPEYTFILPDLTQFPEDFRGYLHKDLIETSTLVSLEQAGRLNWWADMSACQRLLPLATTGDGNCLLHAASLGMWGFHDRLLTLRKALHATITNESSLGAFWRRWRWHQTLANKQPGLVLNEEEWKEEWRNLLKLASSKPKTTPGSHSSCCYSPATNGLMERTNLEKSSEDDSEVFYESLEEFHVFVLAHVLRRPVIVVADTILRDSNGDALAPIPFGGIYLPLECRPAECHRSPLILTYDAAHFSALVAMDTNSTAVKLPAAIPLVNPELNLLPIHFMVDPGPLFVWGHDENDPKKVQNLDLLMEDKLSLIKQYLDVEHVMVRRSNCVSDGDLSAPGECGKPPLARTVSVESDESSNSSGSGKDKGKVSKQMQSVTKSFGSIGKSMSKKLKKNFGGIGRAMKQHNSDKRKNNLATVGSVTQSTRRPSVTVEMLKDRDHILCAKLLLKRLEYQEEMVQNYLSAAEKRFMEDREQRRKQDEEIKQKAEQRRQQQDGNVAAVERVRCVNAPCDGIGTVATSYLCPTCYSQQKQEVPETSTSAQPAQERFERQDTLINLGKSKFYTHSDEKQCNTLPVAEREVNIGHNNKYRDPSLNNSELNNARILRQDRKPPLELSRSSFYDQSLSTDRPNSQRRSATLDYRSQAGTAYFINNLHETPVATAITQEQYKKSSSAKEAFKHLPPILRSRNAVEQMDSPAGIEREKGAAPVLLHAFKTDPVFSGAPTDQTDARKTFVARAHGGAPLRQEPCRTDGCEFFGTDATQFLCSSCFKQKQTPLAYQSRDPKL